MAKKSNSDLLDMDQAYGKTLAFYEKHKKLLMTIGIGLIIVVGAYFGYKKFVSEPHIAKSNEASWKAEFYFAIDSFQLALDGDGSYRGFNYIANEYDGTPAGELATYYSGLCYLHLGSPTQAIDAFAKADLNDDILSTMLVGNMGDAYVELGTPADIKKGATYYEEAANKVPGNSFLVPYWGMKAALVYEKTGNYPKAVEWYTKLKNDFPQYKTNEVKKYLARAEHPPKA